MTWRLEKRKSASALSRPRSCTLRQYTSTSSREAASTTIASAWLTQRDRWSDADLAGGTGGWGIGAAYRRRRRGRGRAAAEPRPPQAPGPPCALRNRPYTPGRQRHRDFPGVHMASTGVAKSSGACRGGSFPRKSSGKLIVANDDNYALAA